MPADNGFAPNPGWAERVKRFVQQAKKAGVEELAEGGPSPDAYQQGWDELLARPWQPSLAFGKKVTLQYPFTPEYTAKKEATLTDGLVGGKDFSLNWLFVYGNDLSATIDLEQTQKVSNVQLNFLQDARHNIFLPTAIMVEVSADGKSYSPVARQAVKPAEEEDFNAYVKTYQLSFNTGTRFVRVTAKCLPQMPAWRGNNKKPALCCDEIFVN